MARLFVDTIFHYRYQRKFLLHHFVVMPTHFHAILSPSEIVLERAVQLIKGGFSYRTKKELGLNIEIWERGYIDHRIRDANDYARHVEYILQNPVKGKLAARPEDYRYCSANSEFELDRAPEDLSGDGILLAR